MIFWKQIFLTNVRYAAFVFSRRFQQGFAGCFNLGPSNLAGKNPLHQTSIGINRWCQNDLWQSVCFLLKASEYISYPYPGAVKGIGLDISIQLECHSGKGQSSQNVWEKISALWGSERKRAANQCVWTSGIWSTLYWQFCCIQCIKSFRSGHMISVRRWADPFPFQNQVTKNRFISNDSLFFSIK